MASLTTTATADTLADALVGAVRDGWMDQRHVRSLALRFVQTSPLEHSGRQKFWRQFERRLEHIGEVRLSTAVHQELLAGKRVMR